MKWIKYVQYVLFAVSIVAFASLFFLPQMEYKGEMHAQTDWMLWWAYAILVIGIIAALISPIKNLFSSPKSALTALIGLVVAAAVIGGCYALSSAAPVPNSAGGFFEDAFELKFTDTVLFVGYLALAGGVISILVGEIRNILK